VLGKVLLIRRRIAAGTVHTVRQAQWRPPRMIDSWWRHNLSRAAEHCRWSRAARPSWICIAKRHLANAIDNPDWLTAKSSQCQPLTAELRAPHHLCSVLHFRLLIGVYFLMVHGRSLSVSDRYWIADSEAADFTGSVWSNFGWIFQPLLVTLAINQRQNNNFNDRINTS